MSVYEGGDKGASAGVYYGQAGQAGLGMGADVELASDRGDEAINREQRPCPGPSGVHRNDAGVEDKDAAAGLH